MSEASKIAISGLNDASLRIANAAKNIVNVSSTGKLPSAPSEKATSYQPTDVITLSVSSGNNNLGVRSETVARNPAYSVAQDSNSPNANNQGLVAAPNVDIAAEIINAKIAEITYRASAAVIKADADNDKKLLDTLT